ncbi:unnamed protein product [Prorocentrum cordatum]|uniref:Uncharacterized protein n=1 Tax=Prorocentrum cordatum TaxID=2364126 RepID=A0ABN9UTX7_9DINO|nr:unnamed protein product [Polarella glacialis]
MTDIAARRRARSLPADLATRHLVQVEGTAQFGVAADAVFGSARLRRGEVPRRTLCGSFREWLRPRLGTGPAVALVGGCLAGLLVRNWFTRTLHWLESHRSVSLLTMLGAAPSLLVAVTVAACREGAPAVLWIFRPGSVVRSLPISGATPGGGGGGRVRGFEVFGECPRGKGDTGPTTKTSR